MRRQAKIIFIAAASGIGALAGGGVPVFAQFQLEPQLGVTETFSDNVDQDPDGQEEEAFITEVTAGAVVRWNGNQNNVALNLGATARHQSAGDNKGKSVRLLPNVTGSSGFELWKDHLFLDASGSASDELLNTGNQNTNGNRGIIQNYGAGPRLVGRIKNFANAQASYRVNQVIDENSSGLGDNTTHTIATSLSAGPDFTRIRWSLNGNASESQRQGAGDVSRRSVSLGLEYVVDSSFSLLGSSGYQTFDDGNAGNDISDITWSAGFRWRPGPRTDITMTYGRQDADSNFAGSIRYALSPQTNFFANYSEALQTGQEVLIQDLSFLGVDPNTGALIDTRTNLPFDPSTSIVSIGNTTQRTSTLTTGLTGVRGRNTFGVTGTTSFTRQRGGTPPEPKERAYRIGVNMGRQLTPESNLGINAGYSRNEFKPVERKDDEYTAGVSYSHSIYRNMSAVGSYNFALQESSGTTNEFIENRVTLGVRMSF